MVPNRAREIMEPEILYTVLRGTTIYSDGHRSYWGLNRRGYRHSMVNHAANFVDPHTGVHTNTIEGLWSHAKRHLRTHKLRRHERMQTYLHEFCFKRMYCQNVNTRFFVIGRVVARYWNLV